MKDIDLRRDIDQLIATNAVETAAAQLARLWREEAGPSAAGFVVSRYEQFHQRLGLVSRRLFILRSFTVEPIVPVLRAAAFVNGIHLAVEVGNFNAYQQEIFDPTSRLYSFAPDFVILAVQTRDIAPELWEGYSDLLPPQNDAVTERLVSMFRALVQGFRSHSQASLIVQDLETPLLPNQGILDSQSGSGQTFTLHSINHELRRIASDRHGVYVVDYNRLVARHGGERWHDELKWLTMRMPIAANHLIHLVDEWLRFLHPLSGKVCKVLAIDLDNTLWKGVIGEEGMAGIQIGAEYPGAAYRALQRAVLDLYHRGIMLAICSKNNVSDAMEALEKHPGMLLRPQHFAALRINWNDKAQSLREIAAELNLGIESLAFLDDNPIERARVRAELPEVTVIELPDDAIGFAKALRETPVFERLALSAEDRERGRYYAEQRQRVELQRSVTSLEDFFRSLRQEVEIISVTSETLVRVAQLTQKTNQFNLTTRRYSEQRIAEMAAASDWGAHSIRVSDRFGDNGIVGVVITHDVGEVCEIDTFLLSCRIIGRTVETALLSFLIDGARTRGVKQLRGWFLPTKKNAPASEFYPTHKFRCVAERDEGTCWALDLEDAEIACPEWIQLTVSQGACAP